MKQSAQVISDIIGEKVELHSSGLYLRSVVGNTTGDEHVIADQRQYRLLPISEGDVVLDIGAHIGAFPILVALPRGAAKIICVEPDPISVFLLHLNTQDHTQVEILEGAIVSSNQLSNILLYQNARMATMHTTVPTRGRLKVLVRAHSFAEVLKVYKPTVIKIDIEGGEFAILKELCKLPEYVRSLAIEIHPYKGDRNHELSRVLADALQEQFAVLREPKIGGNNWVGTGIYSRR